MALEKIDIDTLDPAATIVVATGNTHKLTEIEAILGKVMPEVRFVALGQLGDFEARGKWHDVFGERHHQGAGCGRGDGAYGHRRRLRLGR